MPDNVVMQVTVFSMADLDDNEDADNINCPQIALHRVPSKLASIAWSPDEPVCALSWIACCFVAALEWQLLFPWICVE